MICVLDLVLVCMQDQRVSQRIAVSKLLSLRQDVESAFSPMEGGNELVSEEEGRPVLADVSLFAEKSCEGE